MSTAFDREFSGIGLAAMSVAIHCVETGQVVSRPARRSSREDNGDQKQRREKEAANIGQHRQFPKASQNRLGIAALK